MTSRFIRFATFAFIITLGLMPAPAAAQSVPPVPDNLRVPAGYTLFLATRAAGTQNYVCLPVARRQVGWRFLGPQATLFVEGEQGSQVQAATHFLSVNPAEATVARPTWQHSIDTSKVWGRVLASSSDPAYVAPGAIPWLLLEAAGVELGPDGGGFLAQTALIQRLNTFGGLAPATGCTNDDEIGKVALVPYSTDYFFYRKSQD